MGEMSLVDLGKRLLECAKIGETEEVRILMTNGAPFTTDWLGTSPLHMAAQYGHVSTAEVLLRGGISRDARTKVDRTPLHIAAQEGHLDIVKLLISHGAEIDAKDMLKMTPLHWAVDRGHYQVVKFLLKSKADVTAVSKFDKLPFNIAEDNQHLQIVELLTKHTLEAQTMKQYQPKTKIIQMAQPTTTATAQNVKKNVPLYLKSDKLSTLSPAIRRTLSHTIQTTSPLISVNSPTMFTGSAAKSPTASKPVLLRANLASLQKAAAASAGLHTASSSDSDEGESNDPGCTNVLATLAALAEATAPNSSISTSDALHWLEMNGITMLPTDNSTIVASALEGGQTVSLTEAGKLALTWVKEHQNLNNNSSEVSSTQEQNKNIVTTSESSSTNQKVITIVADQSHIPSIVSSPQTPIVVLSNATSSTTNSGPPLKKLKMITVKKEKNELSNGNTPILNLSDSDERMKLKQELEKMKREAQLYKTQLLQKEHEAEEYKKQLEQIKSQPLMN